MSWLHPTTEDEELVEHLEQTNLELHFYAQLLALTIRIDLRLLRNLRLLFLPKSNIELELEIWFSPIIYTSNSQFAVMRSGVASKLCHSLKNNHPILFKKAKEAILGLTCHLPETDLIEQEMRWATIEGDIYTIQHNINRILKTLTTHQAISDKKETARWAKITLSNLIEADSASKEAVWIYHYVLATLGSPGTWLDGRKQYEPFPEILLHALPKTNPQRIGIALYGNTLEFLKYDEALPYFQTSLPLPTSAFFNFNSSQPNSWYGIWIGRKIEIHEDSYSTIIQLLDGEQFEIISLLNVPDNTPDISHVKRNNINETDDIFLIQNNEKNKFRFQVAFSFAGEHRDYVREVAEYLAQTLGRDAIFYDEWFKSQLARPDLDIQLQTIYQQTRLVVPFLSKEYKSKSWCGLEWRGIRSMIREGRGQNIMLLYFDDTQIDGLFNTSGYINLMQETPQEVAYLILKRLGRDPRPVQSVSLPQPRIDISRLPAIQGNLYGREKELSILDQAWHNPETNILCISAWGGSGKSMLVQSWLDSLGYRGWLGAENIFGWSFYSRGASEEWRASADRFFEDSLHWFGSSENSTFLPPWIKGEKLANLVMKKRTLLILDGMEPFQEQTGELREQGIKSLLRYLSVNKWGGLCVITSRINFRDFRINDHRVKSLHLDRLSTEAAIALLKGKRVTGTDKDFYEAVESVQRHSLSLTLLGNALAKLYNGDLKKRHLIPLSKTDQLQSIMSFYEQKLESTPELMIMYLMGLSDRALHLNVLNILLAPESLPWYEKLFDINNRNKYEKLLAPIRSLDEISRRKAFQHLQSLELIFEANPGKADRVIIKKISDKNEDYTFDCHPLIHEYFGHRFEQAWPEAWRLAHERLYKHYRDSAKAYPDTLNEMEPLFVAVTHGCLAGKAQQVMDEVYWPRIRRKDIAYLSRVLGATPTSLAVLSNFFAKTWAEPLPELNNQTKADVLSWAGYRLRALGRLEAAKEPLAISLGMYERWADWSKAASAASNLAGLYLTLGNTREAQLYAEKSVEYADRPGIPSERTARRTTLANVLHQLGQDKEAQQLFATAEKIYQADPQKKSQHLHSLWGFRYCDFLLDQGEWREVLHRSKTVMEINQVSQNKLDIALGKLIFGRAYLAQAQEEQFNNAETLQLAEKYINAATEELTTTHENHHLPKGLLARARFYRLTHQQLEIAHYDLDQAYSISSHRTGNMRLYQADYHIESAWFALDENRLDDAHHHAQQAKNLIEETSYNRRLPELNKLQQALQSTS